ncbi:MAG: hypothetical protein O3C63_09410 [Cyanobacteria bacterium]|nr:hypothetical protein [Cyanobacteriota bacterium]
MANKGSARSFMQDLEHNCSKEAFVYNSILQIARSDQSVKLRFHTDLPFDSPVKDRQDGAILFDLISLNSLKERDAKKLDYILASINYKLPNNINKWLLYGLLIDYEYNLVINDQETQEITITRNIHKDSSLKKVGLFERVKDPRTNLSLEGSAKVALTFPLYATILTSCLIYNNLDNLYLQIFLNVMFGYVTIKKLYHLGRYILCIRKYRTVMDDILVNCLKIEPQ